VDIRNNHATTKEYADEFLSKPGWQQHRQENFIKMVQTAKGVKEDPVHDGWTELIRHVGMKTVAFLREEMKKEDADMGEIIKETIKILNTAQYQQMEKVRRRIELVVHDPATAESLKPWYHPGCKRPCYHDDYLATFNRPSVHLIDTHGLGVEAFTENGVVAGGVEYPVDVVIFATGFEQPGLDTGGER
jgi:cyclohexanone monooxygenase